jgi:hypothetical protein
MNKIIISQSLYTTELTDSGDPLFPQLVHKLTDGGPHVKVGVRTIPEVLVRMLLQDEDLKASVQEAMAKSKRTGFIFACGNVAWFGHAPKVGDPKQLKLLSMLPMGGTQILGGYLANQLGEFDYISSDGTSCVSSMHALYTADLLLKVGKLDTVVIMSTDNALAPEYLRIFGENGISKSLKEEDDPNCHKFHLSQGVNVTVVTSLPGPAKANLLGCAVTCEQHNTPLGIRPDGLGYTRAISEALEDADLAANEIDFVKPHATNTADNAIESKVIREIFGDIREVNYKEKIGHCMGVSGILETNLAIEENKGLFVSISAGMGNVFAAAVVEIL